MILKGNKFRQRIPKRTAQDENLKTQYIDLEKENILLFQLPENIRNQHTQMMQSLAFIGDNLFPSFYMDNLTGKSQVPFSQNDVEKNTSMRRLALAKTTKDIGWNARNYDTKGRFEYYVWQRQLQFYKFIINLRTTIIETLNLGLDQAGEKIGFSTHLKIENLPEEKDVEIALQKLNKGEAKNFEELLKQFR